MARHDRSDPRPDAAAAADVASRRRGDDHLGHDEMI